MLYTPAHTDLNKSGFEEGLRAFSTRENHQPLSPQTDCVQANSFYLQLGGLHRTGFPSGVFYLKYKSVLVIIGFNGFSFLDTLKATHHFIKFEPVDMTSKGAS